VARLDAFLALAALHPLPWWRAILYWMLRKLVALTKYFGRTFPYVLRPWYRLCRVVRRRLDARAVDRYDTARTLSLRRLFGLQRPQDGQFRPAYAVWNWATFLVFLWIAPTIIEDAIAGTYAYSTYPFGRYRDVIVTQAYRNISDQTTYAVHGYEMLPNGDKKELYFELGPNIWFWNLYPEFMFGQIPILGRCTFDTYGVTLRIPRKLRLFSAGSLYVLNPWIVDMQCTPPTVVPK
jgi:hypothetical protein